MGEIKPAPPGRALLCVVKNVGDIAKEPLVFRDLLHVPVDRVWDGFCHALAQNPQFGIIHPTA